MTSQVFEQGRRLKAEQDKAARDDLFTVHFSQGNRTASRVFSSGKRTRSFAGERPALWWKSMVEGLASNLIMHRKLIPVRSQAWLALQLLCMSGGSVAAFGFELRRAAGCGDGKVESTSQAPDSAEVLVLGNSQCLGKSSFLRGSPKIQRTGNQLEWSGVQE